MNFLLLVLHNIFALLSLKATAETLAHYLLDNSQLNGKLSIARQLARLNRAQYEALALVLGGSIVMIPTDQAWKKHESWLAALVHDRSLRNRVSMAAIGTPSLKYDFGGKGSGVKITSGKADYILFSTTENDETPSTLCIIKSSSNSRTELPALGSCVLCSKPIKFDKVSAIFVDDIILPDEILKQLNVRATKLKASKSTNL